MASAILQVAHPRSSIPKPGRNLPLASLSAACYAHVARSSTRPAMSRTERSPERLPQCWRNSPPSNCRDDAGSPLGVGAPPRLFHVSGKSPLGTCHRGGTFYVLRLPQRTAVSRPRADFMGRDARGASQKSRPTVTVSLSPLTGGQNVDVQSERPCMATGEEESLSGVCQIHGTASSKLFISSGIRDAGRALCHYRISKMAARSPTRGWHRLRHGG